MLRDSGTAHGGRVAGGRGTGWFDVACALAPADFDAERDGVCIHRGGTLLYASPSVLRLAGLAGADGLVGRSVLELFVPKDRARVAGALSAADLAGASEPPVAVHFERMASGGLPVDVTARRSGEADPPVEVLYICAASSPGAGPAAPEGETGSRGGGAVPSPAPTILICDDEAKLGALTAGLLAEYGFSPVTVGTGEEALRELAKADPAFDVVLLDVNLSHGSSARDVLSRMGTDGNSARVVLTSGLAEEDVDADLMSHPSVAGYVAKPYAVEQLVRSLRAALRRRAV